MDLDEALTWGELYRLTKDRVSWRRDVRALRNNTRRQVTTLPPATTTHSYCTRSKPSSSSRTTTNTPMIQPNTTSSAVSCTRKVKTSAARSAARYPARDTHEAFFRPGNDIKRKQMSRQSKSKKRRGETAGLTDKQRAAAAREHYAHHHAPYHDHTNPFSINMRSSKILGHHRCTPSNSPNVLDATLSMRPTTTQQMRDVRLPGKPKSRPRQSEKPKLYYLRFQISRETNLRPETQTHWSKSNFLVTKFMTLIHTNCIIIIIIKI